MELCNGKRKKISSRLFSTWTLGQDFSKEERKALALRSRQEPPQFGSAERQQLILDMHQRALAGERQKEEAKNVGPRRRTSEITFVF